MAIENIENKEPVVNVEFDGTTITLLGTAHVSKASAEHVRTLLGSDDFDAVALELCPSRHAAITNPDNMAKMDMLKVIRQGKASMVVASLALSAYQQRIAEELGIKPGAEMHAAIEVAKEKNIPVFLIDRDVGTTLKRIYRNVPWWRRIYIFSGLLTMMLSSEKVDEQEIERIKQGDLLESMFNSFQEQAHELYQPLIDERDEYMAAKLQLETKDHAYRSVLAVIGAGHLKGTESYLKQDPAPAANTVHELEKVPPPNRWPTIIPWVIVAVILVGFAYGFTKDFEKGWELVRLWVVINGSFCALGALIALAHPLTFIVAFIAAPITSLNPTIGAGMVTGAVEFFIRKPTVGDFSALRTDTKHARGWWKNRVSRILLVFLFTTLGSAIGTYVAGFRIFTALFS